MGDGFQQIQDPCAAVSNFIEVYNNTEYYKGWRIFQDPSQGFKLHMFQFDGSPLAPMFQVSTTPNMLPTRLLRGGVTDTNTVTRRSNSGAMEREWMASVVAAGVSLGLMTWSVMLL